MLCMQTRLHNNNFGSTPPPVRVVGGGLVSGPKLSRSLVRGHLGSSCWGVSSPSSSSREQPYDPRKDAIMQRVAFFMPTAMASLGIEVGPSRFALGAKQGGIGWGRSIADSVADKVAADKLVADKAAADKFVTYDEKLCGHSASVCVDSLGTFFTKDCLSGKLACSALGKQCWRL